MKIAGLLVVLVALSGNLVESRDARQKRTLVYPPPSSLLLIFGLGTPLQLERESVIVGAFTKLLYTLPTNSSELTDLRRSEGTTRWNLYRRLDRLAEMLNLGNGKACVLRAICETAAAPFDLRRGLLHQLLQTLFTPSSTTEEYGEYADREYRAAQRLGEHVDLDGCHALYKECDKGFFQVFTGVALDSS